VLITLLTVLQAVLSVSLVFFFQFFFSCFRFATSVCCLFCSDTQSVFLFFAFSLYFCFNFIFCIICFFIRARGSIDRSIAGWMDRLEEVKEREKRVCFAPWFSAECCRHLLSRSGTLRMRSSSNIAPSTSPSAPAAKFLLSIEASTKAVGQVQIQNTIRQVRLVQVQLAGSCCCCMLCVACGCCCCTLHVVVAAGVAFWAQCCCCD